MTAADAMTDEDYARADGLSDGRRGLPVSEMAREDGGSAFGAYMQGYDEGLAGREQQFIRRTSAACRACGDTDVALESDGTCVECVQETVLS